MRSPLFSLLLLSLALRLTATNAAECTDAEAASADSIWAAAAATSACSPYVTQTDPVYVSAPCTATDCVAVVEGVAEKLPDCTYSGINNKIEVQNALTSCNGGDTEDAGSPTITTDAPATSITDAPAATSTTDAPATSTTTTTPTPTSSSTTDCTTDEYQKTEDLYDAAAATSACSPYSTSSSILVTVDVPCSVTDCIDVMTQLAADLPDCLYDAANQKAELQQNLQVCTDDTTSEVDASTPTATSDSSTPTPASTASSTGCTTTEVSEMWSSYTSTATSDECSADSTIDAYSVYIFTSCDSDCANKVKDLAESLPNCYYDYEYMNKKQNVLEELDQCNLSSSYYISATIYPDSSIELSSSSASSGKSDSEPLVSGESGTTSATGVAESAAPPRVFNGILQLSALFTLLTILAA